MSTLSHLRHQLEVQKYLQPFLEGLEPHERGKLFTVTPDRIMGAVQAGYSMERQSEMPYGHFNTAAQRAERAKKMRDAQMRLLSPKSQVKRAWDGYAAYWADTYAVKIQRAWRTYKKQPKRRRFGNYTGKEWAAIIIQKHWRCADSPWVSIAPTFAVAAAAPASNSLCACSWSSWPFLFLFSTRVSNLGLPVCDWCEWR